MFLRSLALVAAMFLATGAHALTADEARAMAAGESDARIEALNKAVAAGDDRTAAFTSTSSCRPVTGTRRLGDRKVATQ